LRRLASERLNAIVLLHPHPFPAFLDCSAKYPEAARPTPDGVAAKRDALRRWSIAEMYLCGEIPRPPTADVGDARMWSGPEGAGRERVLFARLGDFPDYHLFFCIHGKAAIVIDDIRIERLP